MASRLDSLRLSSDPILTGIAQGISNEAFVSGLLLPEIVVPKETGKFPIFGSESMRIHDTERVLKDPNIKIMPADNFQFDSYQCKEYALGMVIDHREIEVASDILKLDQYYTSVVMESLLLSQEYNRVSLLQDSANYASGNSTALSGNDCWNDVDSKPIDQIKDAIAVIKTKTGKSPNLLVLGQASYRALQEHTTLIEKIKYSERAILTEDIISSIISTKENPITIVVGSGMYEDPITHEFVNLWGDVAILAYVTQTARAQRSKYESTFGYTFTMSGFPYGGQELGEFGLTKKLGAFLMYDYKIVKNSAGYIFTNTNA